MDKSQKVVSKIDDFEVIEVLDRSLGMPRYFITRNGDVISKSFARLEGATRSIELMKDGPNPFSSIPMPAMVGVIGGFITYPIGKAILRRLTGGAYPPDGPHNAIVVAYVPYFILMVVFVALTFIYG